MNAVSPSIRGSLSEAATSSARRAQAVPRKLGVPAVYIGTLLGFGTLPETELYNLVVPVGEYPEGATVTRATLETLAQRSRLAMA